MSLPVTPNTSDSPAPAPLGEGALTNTPMATPANAPKPLGKSLLREILETLILTVVIYLAVQFSTGRFRVEGESMSPTLHTDQYVIVDKVSYRLGDPQRGDIIVFHYPFSTPANERDFIKRVIGLPGETVTIGSGSVTVNGQALNEPYIQAPPNYAGTWILGPDEFFVLGDNRNNSSDSRSWGPLKREFLIGRALLVYWPLENFQWVEHYTYASQ